VLIAPLGAVNGTDSGQGRIPERPSPSERMTSAVVWPRAFTAEYAVTGKGGVTKSSAYGSLGIANSRYRQAT
jgi:hypothetical protein